MYFYRNKTKSGIDVRLTTIHFDKKGSVPRIYMAGLYSTGKLFYDIIDCDPEANQALLTSELFYRGSNPIKGLVFLHHISTLPTYKLLELDQRVPAPESLEKIITALHNELGILALKALQLEDE